MNGSTSLEQMLVALKAQSGLEGAPETARPLPPVEKWNPSHCGEAGLEILRDGSWRHEGAPITRESMVRLFASILRKDGDGETYLVTPAEKIKVKVADAPFIAIRADIADRGSPEQSVVLTTNVGDVVVAGPDHPIRVAVDPDRYEPRPYVLVRGRLEARIARAPFYELAEWAEERGGVMGVRSGGAFFSLGAR